MSVELYDISVQMKSAGYVFRYLRSGQKSRKESECADSVSGKRGASRRLSAIPYRS